MKLSTLKRKAAKQAKMNGYKLKWGNVLKHFDKYFIKC